MTSRTALLVLAAALAACQSPQSRIRKGQAAFDAYPPEVQAAVREGRVETGFTAEQARMALGKPGRVYSRKTASSDQEVWEYGGGGGPSVGLGFGMSSMGGAGGYGTGVGLSTGAEETRPRTRVILEGGAVVAVERRVQ